MSGFEGHETISTLEGLKHPHKDKKKPSMGKVHLRMPLAFSAARMVWDPQLDVFCSTPYVSPGQISRGQEPSGCIKDPFLIQNGLEE